LRRRQLRSFSQVDTKLSVKTWITKYYRRAVERMGSSGPGIAAKKSRSGDMMYTPGVPDCDILLEPDNDGWEAAVSIPTTPFLETCPV